jgi:hypothetical protein
MNNFIKGLFFPTLPRGPDLRPYDSDLEQRLKRWATDVTSQLNSQVQSVGKRLAAGPQLILTNPIHHVAGSAAIATIMPPSGFTGPVWLIADDGWTLVTTGNITFGLTAVPGRAYQLVHDGALWAPVNVI